jgi:AraC-like DNA-binding protein/mannose-6-phosphate isomerase-like protein (cupin superfamily)
MRPELEPGISNAADASFKAFRLFQPAFKSHWHYHPELELVYFARGRGMRFIGDDIALYQEGDLFLIGENLPHTFVSYSEESAPLVEAFCLQFPRHLFDGFAECRPLQRLFDAARQGLFIAAPEDRLVDKIRQVATTTGIPALAGLLDLLGSLGQETEPVPILQQTYQRHAVLSDTTSRIRAAIDYINAHYQHPITLAEIANECHFSPNAFCRWFKQHMGLTFIDYLNKVRLTHVCQLLISTDLNIGQIATQTGFDNISTLNRLFQHKLNSSPRRYRAQHGF